ncbi:unnamed protein product [Citrullus colocynthis]|uniref:Secreted protein n=1 Tax=Citrullus colocynthis TaxID=252529 RepID=A0ABP0ZAE1_9ROSI
MLIGRFLRCFCFLAVVVVAVPVARRPPPPPPLGPCYRCEATLGKSGNRGCKKNEKAGSTNCFCWASNNCSSPFTGPSTFVGPSTSVGSSISVGPSTSVSPSCQHPNADAHASTLGAEETESLQ